MNKIPNLFIIGASKCATTSLWSILKSHPDIFMATRKEPWFFSFSNYKDNLKWYMGLFDEVKNEKIRGEASPIYSETTLIPEIPKRIYNFNPNAKIIYMVREPIDRLKSVWRQTLSSGHWHQQKYKRYTDVEVPIMSKNFEKAIFEYPAFLEACKYWTHLSNYREYFDDENILILFFEDFKRNPKKTYLKVCSFLEIQPVENEDLSTPRNSSENKKKHYSWHINLTKNKVLYKIIKKSVNILGLKAPTKKLNYSIKLNKDIEEKINVVLNDEKDHILRFAQKPMNFWNK